MKCNDVLIINKLGLHARAAAKFVSLANSFDSEVSLSSGDQTVNGKSIMGIMMLAAAQGAELRLCTNGADEDNAYLTLANLVQAKFEEDE